MKELGVVFVYCFQKEANTCSWGREFYVPEAEDSFSRMSKLSMEP
jgi:hypothetical protein